jgi:hypothetical protein
MTIQVIPNTETITYFVVGYVHNTREFFVSAEKTYEHFGDMNTEVTDADEYPGMNIEWTGLGDEETNQLAVDLSMMVGAE